MCTHLEIFRFEVNHEYIIQYVEEVEHNSWTLEVHFDTFSVFQTVWGILYYHPEGQLIKIECYHPFPCNLIKLRQGSVSKINSQKLSMKKTECYQKKIKM